VSDARYSVVLTKEEIDLLTAGLHSRACFIETDTPHLRARDAANAGEAFKALSVDQMRVIVASDDLALRLSGLVQDAVTGGVKW
jgi:hypothetical protein